MLDRTIRSRQLFAGAVEDQVVSVWIVHLMSRTLCASIDTKEGDTLAKLTVDVAAALLDVWPRTISDDETWVLYP